MWKIGYPKLGDLLLQSKVLTKNAQTDALYTSLNHTRHAKRCVKSSEMRNCNVIYSLLS